MVSRGSPHGPSAFDADRASAALSYKRQGDPAGPKQTLNSMPQHWQMEGVGYGMIGLVRAGVAQGLGVEYG